MESRYAPLGNITLKSLKHYINDHEIGELDTIFLSQGNFDDLVLEYRSFYGQPMKMPFIYIAVQIKTSPFVRVALDKVHVVKNDPERNPDDMENNHEDQPEETRADARRRMWWGK